MIGTSPSPPCADTADDSGTASLSGFSGVIELEDVRYLGLHDYSVPATGFNTGRYPVISDPETTELNQAYLQYQQGAFSPASVARISAMTTSA